MPDQLAKYYEYLKANGADVAPSLESFKSTLSDEKTAKQYYSYLKDNQFDAPDTFDSFVGTFGLKKKEPIPSVSSISQSPLLTDLSFKGISEALPKAAKQVGGEFEIGEAAQSKPSRGVKPIADKSLPNIKEAIDDAVNQYQSKYVFSTDAKDKIEKAYKNGDLVPIKNSKGESKLIRGTGVIESFGNAVNKKFEEEATNSYLANAPKQEQIKFLNNKLNNPQEVESAPSGTVAKVSEFVGENAGMLAKGVTAGIGATALALPTGGSSFAQFLSMLPDMAYGGYSGTLEKNYIGLKQSNPNISDNEAYEKAHEAALLGEVTGIATNAALAGSISQNILGKVPKPTVQVKGVMDGIINSAKHAIKSYPKVGGVSVAGSVINDLASNVIGNKVEGDEIGKNALESAKQMAVMHFGLWGLTEPLKIPSYIRPQIENVVASAPREEVQAFYEDGENKGIFPEGTTQKVLSKLSAFDEQKAIVSKMPLAEEQKAAIVGKLLQRKKIEEENSELKKYGASFNDKIEANEKKIEELDAETNNIAKTKDFLKYEKDNLTGRPAKGTPEEISQPIELSIEEEPIITEQEIKTPEINNTNDGFQEAGNKSKNEQNPEHIGNWIIDNGQTGDRIKIDDDSYFELTRRTTKKGNVEIELMHFFKNEKGEFESNPSAMKIFTDKHRGTDMEKLNYRGAGELFEYSYTDKDGNRKIQRSEYIPKEQQTPIKEEVKVETPVIEKAKGFTAKEGNKVVDEKGEPLVVYHGTNSEFSEFDKKRIGKGEGSLLGKGYYFTNKLESAKKYGKNVVKAVVKAANVFDLNSYIKNKEYLKDKRINQDNVFDLDKFLSNLDYSNFDNYYKAFDEIKLYFKNEKELDKYDAIKFKSGDYEEVMVRDNDQIKVIKEESTPKQEIKIEEVKPTESKKQQTDEGLRRAEAKKVHARVASMEAPVNDARQIALRYIADGFEKKKSGGFGEASINEVAGNVKRARLNTGEKEKLSQEVKDRDYYNPNEKRTLDQIAHDLWEKSDQEVSERDIKDALMEAVKNHNTRLEAGKAYLEQYNPEYAEEKYYEKLAEERAEEFDNELKDIEDWLKDEGEKTHPIEAQEEHINNLIKQYEAEFKAEDKQPTTTSEGEIIETPSSRTGGEEVKETKDLGNKARELAAKLRSGDKNVLPDWLQANLPKGTKKQGIDINEAFANALETFADVYDKAKDFKKSVVEASKHITDWYKENGIEFDEADIQNKLGKEFQKQIPKEKQPLKLDEKSILNRIFNSDNISKENKQKFKDNLKYKVASQEEARVVARDIISEYGINDAVSLAEAGKFNGDVNSMIFGESLNDLVLAEANTKNRSEAKAIAEQWADIAIRFDETARDKGRFISAISDFYKKSPLGIKIVEKRRRDDAFKQWFERNGKPYRDVFEEIVNAPEFKDIVKEEVQTELKKERVEYRAKRRKNIEDFFDKAKFKGDATYATIIPPQVINGGLEVMKQAFLAGESALSAVEAAVKHISEKIGDDWDKDRFQKEYEDKLKSLDGGKKKEIDITEDKKIKLLDRFRKKLKGLTDTQKEEVIRKAFKKLVENGALEYEDFKKIIADTLGYGELTAEESARITELVNDINEVDRLAELVRSEDNRSIENLKKYQQAKLKAEKSATELGKIVYNKPDIANRLLSIMQLNTLGIPSLINNPVFNIFNQSLVRFPIGVQLSVIDQILYGGSKVSNKLFGTGVLYPENNVLAGQKEFWKKLFEGGKQSSLQLVTGLTNRDYFQKEVKTAQIHPFTSARELWAFSKGDKNLTKQQIIDKAIQATVGIPAETVARALNIGDKPQRYGSEGYKAAVFAKQLGIPSNSVDYAYFIEFPKEEAYRIFLKKGLSPEEAGLKAENIQKAIIKEGEESTFQQDNLVNDAITAFAKPFGTAGSATKTFLMPFMKIPLNAYWSYFNLVNPEVAFTQSLVYGIKAYKSGSPLDLQESKKWLAHGVTGMALMAIAGAMAKQGIINADNDDKTTKKERQGEKTFEQQKSINVTKLNAYLQGQDPSKVKNSLLVDSKWFGVMGSVLNIQQSKIEDMTPEQKQNGLSLMEDVLGTLKTSSVELIDNGVFSNTSGLLTAINKGGTFADAFFMNLINMGTNIVHPAMAAQLSRAELPYYSKVKADSFFDEVKNNMTARSGMIRTLSGHYPPSQIGIWGDTLDRKDNVFMKLFGMSSSNKDNFAQPIYEDYKRTGNTKFFPSAIKPEIDKVKLNTLEAEKLEMLVGQARKELAMPYFNNGAMLEGFDKKYSELSDTEKIKALQIIYEQGYEKGKEQFYIAFPKYKPKEKDWDSEMDESEEIYKSKSFKSSIKSD